MNLYFLRHGLAGNREDWKGADRERPLTEEGVKKMKKAAKGLRELDAHFDWILTSPYRRAYDTARLVAQASGGLKNLRISNSLAPDGDATALLRHLARDFRAWESILLVGPEPALSRFIGVLLGIQHTAALDFKKGSLCKLTAPSLTYGPCATLEWLLPSKILRALA